MNKELPKDFDPSKPLDNAKHERLVIAYFQNGGNATRAAVEAGYTEKSAHNTGVRVIKDEYVCARLSHLREKEWEDNVMSISERRSRLSSMGRGDVADYAEAGKDGTYLMYGPDSPNTQAVSEISSVSTDQGAMITKLKLRDPSKAIDTLNRMDGVYVEKHEVDTTVNVVEIPAQIDAPIAPDSD